MVKQPSKTESILCEALGEGKEVDDLVLTIERGCVICTLREVATETFKNLNKKTAILTL